MDFEAAADLLGQDQIIHDLLIDLGYNPETEFETLIEAFHRHYFPEKFLEGVSSTLVNAETIARILALIRQRNDLSG
jgi:N-acetyl-anhydromuramyl-L-alanine amidase AmpD